MRSFTALFVGVLLACQAQAKNLAPLLFEEASPRIIGGVDASKGEFKSVVSIKDSKSGLPVHFCSGVIVSDEYVLTAAACFISHPPNQPENLKVVAAEYDLTDVNDNNKQRIPIITIIAHPNFNLFTLANNIALVQLGEKLQWTSSVVAAALPAPGSNPGDSGVVVGWGSTSPDEGSPLSPILQKLMVNQVPTSDCSGTGITLNNGDICYRGNVNSNTCEGDAGGPVYVGEEVSAIVSHGTDSQCTRGLPTICIQVSNYVDWINSIIGGSQ